MAVTFLRLVGVSATLRSLKDVIKSYRVGVIVSLATSLDNIRRRAAKEFIIPKRSDLKGEFRPYVLRKKQPSHPTKLTERKGILKRMLLQDIKRNATEWTGTKSGKIRSRLKLSTQALQGLVKVSSGLGTDKETYEGTLRVFIKSTSGLITARTVELEDSLGNKFNKRISNENKRTLFFRFMHEFGLRGTRRQFIEPAAMKEQFLTGALIREKLNIVGRL